MSRHLKALPPFQQSKTDELEQLLLLLQIVELSVCPELWVYIFTNVGE